MPLMNEAYRCCLQAIGCSGIDCSASLHTRSLRPFSMGHLSDINKSYFNHLLGAWKMSFWFALGAIRLLFHGLIPDVDIKAGQNTVDRYFSPKD